MKLIFNRSFLFIGLNFFCISNAYASNHLRRIDTHQCILTVDSSIQARSNDRTKKWTFQLPITITSGHGILYLNNKKTKYSKLIFEGDQKNVYLNGSPCQGCIS